MRSVAWLPLHALGTDDSYLGVFLGGAYQEILGDLHNLFGDTHAVHFSLDEPGNAKLDTRVWGARSRSRFCRSPTARSGYRD